ncbi:MAG: class I SAM-dependent RNA methyltransferase, partial [Gemmatimonadales bacterium]
RRIAKLDLPDPEVVEAVEEWRYRAKLTLAAPPHSRRSQGAGATVGLRPFDRPTTVFSLHDCHITDLKLMDLWRVLRTRLDRLPRPLRHVVLRLDREGREHVIAESGGPAWGEAEARELRAELSAAGHDVVLWWKLEEGLANIVAGPAIDFPATAFEQVNPDMGRLTRAWAVEQLGPLDQGAGAVWDLYGGVGDTAALLAAGGAGPRVVSVDADESAVAWARRRADAPGVRWIAAKVEDIIGDLDEPAAVVVNPPRRGLHRAVVTRLSQLATRCRVVYVSCDPATLARDLSRLHPRYVVSRVRAFDLFPQTAHVETVAVLDPA